MPARPDLSMADGERVILEERPLLPDPRRAWTRWLVTDRRVVAVAGLPGFRRIRSLPLGAVQDATVCQQLWRGDVTITTAGGQAGTLNLGPFGIAHARSFAEAILAEVQRVSGEASTT